MNASKEKYWKNPRLFWLGAAILWCMAIFIATASPSSTGSHTQSLLVDLFRLSEQQAAVVNVIFRKGVHLGAFGFLALLFYNGLRKRRFLSAWLFTTLYAATDEFHQLFIPERTGSFWDVCLDSLGAVLVLTGIRLLKYKKLRRKVVG